MAGKRRRILYVVNNASYFNAHWIQRARAARTAGYDTSLAAPDAGALQSCLGGELDGLYDLSLDRRSTRPVRELYTLAALRRLYLDIRPDLVHHITIKPVLYGGLAARLTSVSAVVNTIPGLGFVFLAGGLRGPALRTAASLAYRVALRHPNSRTIFENPDDRDEFCARGLIDPTSTVVIKGAGVDMREYSPTDERDGTPVVLLASRLLWDKGVGEFVEAAKIIRASGTTARFVLVGDTDPGNPAAIPRSRLQQWQQEGIVEWWGLRTDMPEVLSHAHIVCLPSYREGLPRVLIEAAACGRAIVTTDVPGCREIGRHGENALLVPVRNAPSLAASIHVLLEDSNLRRAMGVRGREIAQREFSPDKVIAETLAVYRDLLSGIAQRPNFRPT